MKETTVAMLDMSKTILEKVSFDKILFRKELSKAVRWLKPDEKMLLKVWALATFGNMYKDVILDVYKGVTKS
ncbi:MAG TPA: hypothetical protein VGO45_03155 [Bacteroidia bacterium]|nr:hypothetical protein [Bacteroidia bacterium]